MATIEHNDHRKVQYKWESPEFHKIPRGKWWYLSASLIFTTCLIYGLVSKSISMLAVFIILGFTFYLVDGRNARVLKTEITDMGINFNNKSYLFHQISAFWVVYHPPYVDALYLKIREGSKLKTIKIELNQEDPKPIRKLLIEEIPEIEGAGEPTIDILCRLFKIH